MANRVPLIVDTSTLFIKELPLGDGLDLTGCNLVGVTSFTRSDGFEFSGITTFSSGVVFNDGYTANTAKISDLGENRVLLCTSADGEVGDSADLTFSSSTLTAANVTITGDTNLGNASGDTITATGRFDSALVPSDDDTYDLGASDKEWKDLYVDGVGNIDSLAVGVLTHTGLNQNRVLLVTDSDGTIGDNAGLSYDGSTLAVTGDITASGNLNYQTVTDIRSVGVVTASSNLQVGAGISVVGVSTFKNPVNFVDINHTGIGTFTDVKVGGGLTVTGALHADGGIACDTDKFTVADTSGNTTIAGTLDVDGQTDLDVLNVAEAATFSDSVKIVDDKQLTLGTDDNLYIKHSDGHSKNFFVSSVGDCEFHMASSELAMELRTNSSVDLYYDATKKFATSGVGASVYGTGVLKIPVGTTAQRPATGEETEGDIRYNTTTKSFEGYGNSAWGGLGGGTEIDNVVVTTSATGIGTFVKTDYRSASVRVQITQGSNYQVGRYLMIHDDTTVTVVEEAAIATNSMLGTIDGIISGSNAVLRVTMGSASSATITTIIDKISV